MKARRHTYVRVALISALALAPRLGFALPANDGKTRVAVEVTLGPPSSGSEGLGYFVPEVARALEEGFQRGGVLTAAVGTLAADALSIKVDERPGDRVTLSARFRGQRTEVEGTVESMDVLVDELLIYFLPLVGGTPPPAPVKPVRTTMRTAPKPPEPDSPKPSPNRVPTPPVVPPPVVTPPVVAPAVVTPPVMTPPVVPTPTVPAIAETPPAPAKEPRVVDPYGPDARVNESAVVVPVASSGFVRGRAVVHTIADPPVGEPGAGSVATQALYAVLQRRLHVSVVPYGVGMTSQAVAAEEGQRTQSRNVVMARIDGFSSLSSGMIGEPPGARMRLEISVVREGRLVMRRMLVAEAQPAAVLSALAEGRRGRTAEPTYLAITRALESIADDLGVALSSGASDAR